MTQDFKEQLARVIRDNMQIDGEWYLDNEKDCLSVAQAIIDHMTPMMKEVVDKLDKLSKLGNEPYFGNSTGNLIAREALAAIPDVWRK